MIPSVTPLSNVTLPQDPPPSDIRQTIDLIRDQVDLLQVQAAERKRPWYHQPSILMSLIALIVSVVFSSLSVYFRHQDKIEGDKEHLVSRVRENVSALADLQVQQGDEVARAGANAQMVSGIMSAFNAKRQLLIEDTESLIGASGERMTSALYVSFAYQLMGDARVDDASRYFRLALSAAKTNLARANVHRGFGLAMMIPGRQVNVAEARKHWREAIATLAEINDDYSTFLTADNLRVWALAERSLGNSAIADSLINESQKVTDKIVNTWNRNQMGNLLATDRASAPLTGDVRPAGTVMGDWQLRLSDGRQGTLSLAVNTFNQMWMAQMSITDRGKVVELRQGAAPPTDGGSMFVTWQGQRFSETSLGPVPTSGTSRFQRVDGQRFVGIDEILGGKPITIELAHTSARTKSE